MCALTKVANASGLVTATLSQLAQTISVVKNNYTKRKGAKVTILKKRKENKEQNNNKTEQKRRQQNKTKKKTTKHAG